MLRQFYTLCGRKAHRKKLEGMEFGISPVRVFIENELVTRRYLQAYFNLHTAFSILTTCCCVQ